MAPAAAVHLSSCTLSLAGDDASGTDELKTAHRVVGDDRIDEISALLRPCVGSVDYRGPGENGSTGG